MLSTLLSESAALPLLARMLTTASVVVGVALIVGRLGPVVGGAVAGLPIVLGPAFFFLLQVSPPDFAAEVAGYTLLSLGATQAFLLAYILVAARSGPWQAWCSALASWGLAAALCRLLPPHPALGAVLFMGLVWVTRTVAARHVQGTAVPVRGDRLALLVLRGLLAGVLVALVTALANRLGPVGSGLLLSFPVALTVLSITLHQQYGRQAVIGTLYSAALGTLSVAGFSAAMAVALPRLPVAGAFAVALGTSVLITLGLVLRVRRRASS